MKQRFTIFIATLILSVCFPLTALAYAYDVVVDGIYYNLVAQEKTAEVTSGYYRYTGEITIPETITVGEEVYNVTSIGEESFYYCRSLTSVTIPNSVTSIGLSAFANCTRLTSVTIPNSVTSIGYSTFSGCSSLTSVTFPNSVTSIGVWAFSDCRSLTSVTIPNSVTSIGDGAFSWCPSLSSISVDPDNTIYDSRDNCNAIIRTSDNVLIAGCQSTIIPNSVTSIGNDAFSGCDNLSSVTIPNSVISIGGSAFYGCFSLTSVTIPNSVTSIGYWAFAWCKNLKNVYCYAETVPNTDTDVFGDSNVESATLYVPAPAIDAYKTTKPWRTFGTIVALDDDTGINSVSKRGIAIQTAAGFITISGLYDNEKVDFYTLNGTALGTARATNGVATFSAQSGSVLIVRIGNESVKIIVE